MTRAEKKEVLSRYLVYAEEIAELESEISRCRAIADKLICRSDAQEWNDDARVQRAVEELRELEEILTENRFRAVKWFSVVVRSIESVTDGRLRSLLRLRYIDGKIWEDIADDFYIDYRWVLRLHNRALDAIEIKTA